MKRWMCLLALLSLLCGCRPERAVGEQAVVTGLGISGTGDRWELSIQAVEALRTAGSLSEQSEAATAVYTAAGPSVAEALQAFLNETGKRTYILQNQIVVLSLDSCRTRSLFSSLDYFIRNQEGRALVELAVCRGDPAALLDITAGSDAIPAEYVSQLLEEGHRTAQSVTAQLLDAERALAGTYDAALPILEVKDGVPQLAGTALFRDGHLAGELTVSETTGLLLAAGESPYCLYTRDGTTLRLEKLSTALHFRPSAQGWQVEVAVSAVTRRLEGQATEAFLRRVEQELSGVIETALRRTVNECNADPLGLSRRIAARYRDSGVTQQAVRASLAHAALSASVSLANVDSGFLQN